MMKNNICGFSQRKAVELGLRSDDLIFLRWFVDFSHSPKMKKRMICGNTFFWVDYRAVLKDLPILKVSKGQLRRRILNSLVRSNVLTHKQVRESGPHGGTFSYFGFGKAYETLIEDDADKAPQAENRSTPCGKNATPPVAKKSQQRPFSYKDLSIKQVNKASFAEGRANDDTCLQDEKERYDPELIRFVGSTYPRMFERALGHRPPPVKPYQRRRVLDELTDYMDTHMEDVSGLESAAEGFLNAPDHGNGSIVLFAANPKIAKIRLLRQGFDSDYHDLEE